jgi:8-oxo-dGTP pyrophosphatase MutT (NUDIX family)
MNKYLEKIAQDISKRNLPYRDRVEVLILKDGKLLITKNKNKDTGEEWYGFPGGGLDGSTPEKTCINECLEEVGIKIKNPVELSVPEHTQEGIGKKDNRHLKFRGSKTKWYKADYVEVDRSKQGTDDDSRKYSWRTLQEALGDVKKGKVMSTHRVKAIEALKGYKSV